MANPPYHWARYLSWMLLSALAMLAAAGAFNILIDPQGVFNSPRLAGLNALKPYLDHHREITRLSAARRHCATAGIFGNSRAEIGFDPENPAFVAQHLSAFNHAIPGTSASTVYDQINWLKAAGCMPQTIVLGVEFFDFLGGYPADKQQKSTPAPRLEARFFAESVFSITALRDSLTTLRVQHARYPAISTSRGFNPLQHYTPEVENNGHYVLFRQRAQEYARNWSKKEKRLRPADGGISADEQMVDAILTLANESGSTVYLVIYPYHAEIRVLIERLELGHLFSEWKKNIVAMAERHAHRGGKVEVWDFSGLSPETREDIPAKGDRSTQMMYYWEPGHFKSALGDKIIARMLGGEVDFGIKLEASNVDSWLAKDRAAVHTLLSGPSPVVAEVDDIVTRLPKR